MRIYSKSTLRQFWERHPDVEEALRNWYKHVLIGNWNNSAEVTTSFPNARSIGNSRIIFNIRGNRYRLVVFADYRSKVVYVRFIGTHAEYNRINALEI